MTAFTRTPAGLSNQHLFYGVDLIIYLEGGEETFTKDQVYDGSFNDESLDEIFWKLLFAKLKVKEKVKFKPVGSKTTILQIADDIVSDKLKSVMVAMDSEFDQVEGKHLNHESVHYTFGYSWENDIWNIDIVVELIETLTAQNVDVDAIKENFDEFAKNIRIGVFADAYLFRDGKSFFPRKKGHLACVECQAPDLPSLKKDTVAKWLNDASLKRSTLNAFGRRKNINVSQHCYGHLLADYCCQLISHYLKNRIGLQGISKAIMHRMSIGVYFNTFFQESPCLPHYRASLSRSLALDN